MVDSTFQFISSSFSGIQWNPMESTIPGGEKGTHPNGKQQFDIFKLRVVCTYKPILIILLSGPYLWLQLKLKSGANHAEKRLIVLLKCQTWQEFRMEHVWPTPSPFRFHYSIMQSRMQRFWHPKGTVGTSMCRRRRTARFSCKTNKKTILLVLLITNSLPAYLSFDRWQSTSPVAAARQSCTSSPLARLLPSAGVDSKQPVVRAWNRRSRCVHHHSSFFLVSGVRSDSHACRQPRSPLVRCKRIAATGTHTTTGLQVCTRKAKQRIGHSTRCPGPPARVRLEALFLQFASSARTRSM